MFSIKEMFITQSFNLSSVVAIFTALALVIFGVPIANGAALLIIFNLPLDAAVFNSLIAAAGGAGFTLRIIGAAIFLIVAYKTRFQTDHHALKRQALRLATYGVLILSVFVIGSLIEAPLVKAETFSATGGFLSTPFASFDYFIGKHNDGTAFCINGSTWNDLTAVEPWQASPVWLSFAANSTALVEAALSTTTYGTVYLKEVSFNYNLTVPQDVAVVESVNGTVRTYINVADSAGSPYTVSVDNAVAGYYMCQDSADAYINLWSSTNATVIVGNAVAVENSTVYVKNGLYTFSGRALYADQIYYCVKVARGVSLNGESRENVIFTLADSTASNIFLVGADGDDVTFQKFTIDGNSENQFYDSNDGNQCGIFVTLSERPTLKELNLLNCTQQGIYDSVNTGVTAYDIDIDRTGLEGFALSASSYGRYEKMDITNAGTLVQSVFHAGMYVSGGAVGNYVGTIFTHNNTLTGFSMQPDVGTTGLTGNIVENIRSMGNPYGGFLMGSFAVNTWVEDNTFIRLVSIQDGELGRADSDGMRLNQFRYNKIYDYTVYNTMGSAGLRFDANVTNNFFYALYAYDNLGTHRMSYALIEDGSADNTNNFVMSGDVSKGGFTAGKMSISNCTVSNVIGYP